MEPRQLTSAERAFIERMPKAELHVHLEGAVRPETLLDLGRKHGVSYPFTDVAGAREWYRFRDFDHFIEAFIAVVECLLDVDDFERITWELAEDAARQNLRYLEVILSPASPLNPRSTALPDVVWDGARAAAARAKRELDVQMQFRVDAVRVRPVEDVMATYRWAAERMGDGLVGVDLGGTEVGCPPTLHRAALDYARGAGLRISLHAGETVGPESVWAALECGAERIGHGVTSILDELLVRHLTDEGIVLEVSPTSNICLGVAPSYAAHPFRKLHDAGVLVTVNSDDPPMFDTTLTNEYLVLAEHFGFTTDELAALSLRAVQAAFLPQAERAALAARFERELAELGAELKQPVLPGRLHWAAPNEI